MRACQTCYKDPAFLDFFFARVRPNAEAAASPAEVQRLLQLPHPPGADRRNGAPEEDTESLSGLASVPEWDARDWPAQLAGLQQHSDGTGGPGGASAGAGTDVGVGKATAERLAARIAQRAGYTYFSPCQGELNFIRPLEADGTAVVYRDLVSSTGVPASPSVSAGSSLASHLSLTWAGRRLEPFDPAALTLNPATGRMYHPSPRPLARAGLPVCALADSLVLSHMADALESLDDGDCNGSNDGSMLGNGPIAQLHWHGQTFPIHAFTPAPSRSATAVADTSAGSRA